MDSGDLVLGLRVVLALACVLALMGYLSRRVARGGSARRQRAATMSVVGRQSLGGKTGLALVEVGGRRLLLGISERGVNLLTEIEVEAPAEQLVPTDLRTVEQELADLVTLPPTTPAARMPAVPKPRNPLEGSILDAATWRQAVVAAQERTIRR